MKSFVRIFLFFQLIISNAQNTPYNNPNEWNLVFYDQMDYQTLNELESVWKLQHGEKRYLSEQVFLRERVELTGDNQVALTALYHPNFIINPDFGNFIYINANGKDAKYSTGEIYTKQKFLYGYIEAKVKLPSGHGTMPFIWLMPLYRERESNEINAYEHFGRYPEEIDLIEQRSYKNHVTGTQNNHIYDFCSFWNNSDTFYAREIDNIYPFENLNLAGEWHTYAVKWDIFTQEYYIDGVLVFTNDLWNRKSHAESMNIIISNNILTNTSDSDQNPDGNQYDTTIFSGKEITFADGAGINDEKVTIDYVKVHQQKKYGNPVVWASGKTHKFGNFDLQGDLTKFDKHIIGNFIVTESNDADEIISFSTKGQSSSFQRIINFREVKTLDVNDNSWPNTNYYNDIWDVETIKSEIRNESTIYTLNDFFTENIVDYTKYCVGNFDGIVGDELFFSNNALALAYLIKFDNNQNIPNTNHYLYNELYNNRDTYGTTNTIRFYNINGDLSSVETRDIHTNDIFVSGNFDGETSNRDKLLWLNTSTGRITMLKYMTNGTQKYFYKIFDSFSLNSWNISSSDQFLVANFDNDINGTEDLMCINKTTGLIHLYKFENNSWFKIWDNNNTSNPKKILDWWLNPNDRYLAGSFLNDEKTQLLCIKRSENNQDLNYAHLYEFSLNSNQSVDCIARQQSIQPAGMIPEEFECYNYNYRTKNGDINTTLLSFERYAKRLLPPHNYRYFSSLVSFSEENSSPVWNRSGLNKVESSNSSNEKKISIYPNPSEGDFIVNLNSVMTGKISLHSVSGDHIFTENFYDSDIITIKRNGIKKGIYIISLQTEKISNKLKLIIN